MRSKEVRVYWLFSFNKYLDSLNSIVSIENGSIFLIIKA